MGIYSSKSLQQEEKNEFIEHIKSYVDEKLNIHAASQNDLQRKYDDLKVNYESLKREYKKLENSSVEVDLVQSKISDQAIDKFVQHILNNPKSNMHFIPDAIESSIYKSAMTAFLHSLAHFADASHISFMGHELKISIIPEE